MEKIEKMKRSLMVEELVYLLTELEEMEELKAMKMIAELNDIEIVNKMNLFYDGTGIRFDMVKIK